jgi:hypothetical protein
MWLKVLPITFLLALVRAPSPLATNPAFDNYNDIFVRGAKSPGFWGAVGPQKSNVFDEKWNGNGYHSMYNLNSNSPMAGNRGNGFDATTTMFNQYGPTSFEVIPVQSNFMPQSRLNAYTYDLNEPRMAQIYKNYLRFMNKNLDRLDNVLRPNTDFGDLNHDNAETRLKTPRSQNLRNNYFDGLNAQATLPSYYHQPLRWEPQQMRTAEERRLVQQTAVAGRQKENAARVRRLRRSLHHIEAKLKTLEASVLPKRRKARRNRRVIRV